MWHRLRAFWLRHDPDAMAARRALRAVLVTTPLFAIGGFVLDEDGFALATSFGSFSLLVMADFQGPYRTRAAACAAFTVVGAALIAGGTLASEHPWVAIASAVVVGFVFRFSAVFGGRISAASAPLLIVFSLGVLTPGGADQVVPRVLGLVAAGVAGAVAMVLIFPVHEQRALRSRVAVVCRRIGDALTTRDPADLAALRDDVRAMRALSARIPNRSNGPGERQQALGSLVDELSRCDDFVAGAIGPTEPDAARLRALLATQYRACAAAIDRTGPGPDVSELDGAREAYRIATQGREVDDLRSGADPGAVVRDMEGLLPLRGLTILSISIAANARRVAGLPTPQVLPLELEGPRGGPGLRASLHRGWEILSAHFTARSVWLRTSVQTALALTLAVVAANLTDMPHGFWIALGTIGALRSNAADTGSIAIQAVIGTALGVLIAGGVVILFPEGSVGLWVLLPVVIVLAATAPTFGGAVPGQAAFALFVVVFVNLLDPEGWRVGVIRLEAVALGAGISVVASLLLWPRGAATAFARSVADLFRAASADVGSIPAPSEPARSTRAAVTRARRRADVAYEDLLRSRRGEALSDDVGVTLLTVGGTARMSADLLGADAPEQAAMRIPGGLAVLVQARVSASASLGALADTVSREPVRFVLPLPTVDEAAGVLATANGNGRDDTAAAVHTLWAVGWLREVHLASERARPAAEQVALLAAQPWWRWHGSAEDGAAAISPPAS